jgi:tetratricopeptide (TPR) repeat protein
MWFAAFLVFALQAREPLELAWQLAARGDRPGAEAVLQKLLVSDGTNTDAHLLYGNLLAEDGNKDGALAELNIAVGQRPHSAEAWNSLGEICHRFKRRREALDAFNKAVLADSTNGVAQSNLAQSFYEAGQKDAAKEHAVRAMALLGRSKDAADAAYLLGKLELNAGEPGKAADYFTQAVQLVPDFASAWSDLGQAKKLLLDGSGSIAAFSQAAKLDGNDAVAQYRLGAEYLRQDKPAEALAPLEAATRANGEDQSSLNALATAYQRLGRLEEAAQTRRKLSEVIRRRDLESQNALSALRLNNRGAELEKVGKLKDALDLYKQAVELNGKHAGIRSNYAVALLRLGQWRDGLEEMKQAQDLDPENKGIETALKDAILQAPASELPEWARSVRIRLNQIAPTRNQTSK